MKKLDIAKWIGVAITIMVIVFAQIRTNAIKEVAIDTATVINIEQDVKIDTIHDNQIALQTNQTHILKQVDSNNELLQKILERLPK